MAPFGPGYATYWDPPCDSRPLYRYMVYPYVIRPVGEKIIIALQSDLRRLRGYFRSASCPTTRVAQWVLSLNTSSLVHVAVLSTSSCPEHTHNCLLSCVHLSYTRIYPHYPVSSQLRSILLSNTAVTHCITLSQHHLTNRSTGNLWKTGYSKGELKTPLFNDVIPTLETWKNAGKTLAIFSSGSVQAQLQFFSYVENGSSTRDLKPLFSAHFDTVTAGSKLKEESYVKICREMGVKLEKVTFLTDNVNGMLAVSRLFPVSLVIHPSRNISCSSSSPITWFGSSGSFHRETITTRMETSSYETSPLTQPYTINKENLSHERRMIVDCVTRHYYKLNTRVQPPQDGHASFPLCHDLSALFLLVPDYLITNHISLYFRRRAFH
jgi:hypothetical protein